MLASGEAGIRCILTFALVFLLCYVVGQTGLVWRLARLVWRRDGLVTGDLAGRCVLNLFVFPQVMLLPVAVIFLVTAEFGSDREKAMFVMFNRWGFGLSMLCYFAAGLALSYCLARAERLLYRGAIGLLAMVVMAIILLNYSAAIAVAVAWGIIENPVTGYGTGAALAGLVQLVAFYIPTSPLAGLVLLIVHTFRVDPPGESGENRDSSNPADQ